MTYADEIFKKNIQDILLKGSMDENPRPKYESDGVPAHSIFVTQVFEKYDIGNGVFPITTLRPINVENGIKEIEWIYKGQTSSLSKLEGEYGIKWWNPWDIGDGTIGQRYGATVGRYNLIERLLYGLVNDPFGRRHIISLWQESDFEETEGLKPCAYETLFTVRKHDGIMYLDMTLIQRSSDYLVAGHINKMQYVAFMMMVANHCGYRLGVFSHFVQNLHIYDRHMEQARILLARESQSSQYWELGFSKPVPKLVLLCADKTNFFDISHKDFKLYNYHPVKPQLKFDLGI